jgi:hypothetical protein
MVGFAVTVGTTVSTIAVCGLPYASIQAWSFDAMTMAPPFPSGEAV